MTQHVPRDDEVIRGAHAAADAVRALNDLTQGRPIPAPMLTHLLGNLQCVTRALPQMFGQLGDGLQESFDLHEVRDGAGDAQQNVIDARAYLVEAAELACEIADLLEAAQSAIALQRHYVTSHDDRQ